MKKFVAKLIKAVKKMVPKRIIIPKAKDGKYYLPQHQGHSIIPTLDAMDEQDYF